MLMNKSGNLMVPTARLELARPKSLPPQDSVSTNSTTSATGMRPDSTAYCGMSPALVPALLPGACAGAAGCACVAGTTVRSSTLAGLCCCKPKYARPRLVRKNRLARTAVLRLRKLAEPLAPNRLPDEPLPNAAPMSAPLPCCKSTNAISAMATRT